MANSEDTPITPNYVTVSGRVTPTDGIYREKIPVKISQEEGMEETLYTDSEGYYEGTILLGSSNDIIAKVGNDKAIWKLIDGIVLSSDKQIISYNGGNNPECATITAQLTKNNSNVNISGENITFEIRKKSDDSLVETLTATTDSSGIATVSYYGKGTGDLYIKCFSSNPIIVSKTYGIEDIAYYNSGDHITGLVNPSNADVSTNGTYITITSNTSGEKWVYPQLDFTTNDNFSIEAEYGGVGTAQFLTLFIKNPSYEYAYVVFNDGGVYGRIFDNSGTISQSMTPQAGDKLKLEHNNGITTIYVNDVALYSKSGSYGNGTFHLGFYTNNGRLQTIKNIKIRRL